MYFYIHACDIQLKYRCMAHLLRSFGGGRSHLREHRLAPRRPERNFYLVSHPINTFSECQSP